MHGRALLAAMVTALGAGAGWVAFGDAWARSPLLGQPLAALGETLSDPLHYFALRSPGGREPGALYQTKQRVAAGLRSRKPGAGPMMPFERVLSNVRGGPVGAPSVSDPLASLLGDPQALGDPLPGGDPLLAPFTAAPLATPIGGYGPGSGGSLLPGAPNFVPTGGLLTPSGGGGGGGGGGGTPVPDGSSAVPEPATWWTMIGGMMLTGAALRRVRRGRTVAFAEADASAA